MYEIQLTAIMLIEVVARLVFILGAGRHCAFAFILQHRNVLNLVLQRYSFIATNTIIQYVQISQTELVPAQTSLTIALHFQPDQPSCSFPSLPDTLRSHLVFSKPHF